MEKREAQRQAQRETREKALAEVGLNPETYRPQTKTVRPRVTLHNRHLFDYARTQSSSANRAVKEMGHEVERLGMRRQAVDRVQDARRLAYETAEVWDEL